MLEALYQNFVVNGFGVEGEQLKRYEAGQSKLAGILGLDPAVKMKVCNTVDAAVVLALLVDCVRCDAMRFGVRFVRYDATQTFTERPSIVKFFFRSFVPPNHVQSMCFVDPRGDRQHRDQAFRQPGTGEGGQA